MGIEKKELDYAKESGDIGQLAQDIASDIKDGKNITEIMSTRLGGVTGAVAGADQIDDEMEENLPVFIATVCYHVGYAVGAMMKKKKEAATEQPSGEQPA